jgi:glyoxylase-like metal-dependent hydrolase (beta-lactamase superfamily II)
MSEVAPGVHRIESDLGPRFMCQYLIVGTERTLLVDTGIAATPVDVIAPYLDRLGVEPDFVMISHADVDHSGGNRALRKRYPSAVLACHELDRRWIESNKAMLRENYLWHEQYGFEEPDEAGRRGLLDDMGGDCPVDLGLRGGETIRLGPGRRVEILHLPGHTCGHLGVWDPDNRAAIVIDAVLADGIYDRAGRKLIPPRYYDLAALRETIVRLQSLRPELLLTAHYPVFERDAALEWLDTGRAFVDDVERVVGTAIGEGTTDPWRLTQRVDAELGPFPEFMTELGATVQEAARIAGASEPAASRTPA